MTIPTLKVLASLLQLHGPGSTVQSDHPGINALLDQSPDRVDEETRNIIVDESGAIDVPAAIPAYFGRGYYGPYGGFRRGYVGPYGGFRRGYVAPYGGFRRAFGRAY